MQQVQEKAIQFLVEIYKASNGVAGRLVGRGPIMTTLGISARGVHNTSAISISTEHRDLGRHQAWGPKPLVSQRRVSGAAEEIIAKDNIHTSDPLWMNAKEQAMQVIKSYRGISLIHQGLINQLVNGTKACDAQGCRLLWMIDESTIGFSNIVPFFKVKISDIEFLEQRGWVEVERDDLPRAAHIRASNKSHLAALRQFGRCPIPELSSDEHAIICAAYAAADGKVGQQFLGDAVAKILARWTVEAVQQSLTFIANKGYLISVGSHGNFGGLFWFNSTGAAFGGRTRGGG